MNDNTFEDSTLQILEPTEEAKQKFLYRYGVSEVHLTPEQLQALMDGRMLAWHDGEYSTFVASATRVPLSTSEDPPVTALELGQELRDIAHRLQFSHAQLVASEVAEIAYIGIVRDEVGVAVKDLLALAEMLDPGGEPLQEEGNEQDDG